MLPPFVVVPTYRECDNLPPFTQRLWASVPDARLLVVDDASGDGTPDWVKAQPQYGKQLFILERAGKLGLGSAYLAGFAWVIERHRTEPCGAVVQMDADLSHKPESVPELVAAIDRGADLVLATRYREGVRVTNWPLRRLLLSLGGGLYVRTLTRMPFSDLTGGFKCWKRETLEEINLDQIFSNGYLFQIEMTWKAYRKGAHIGEIPIIFYEREIGRSKINSKIILEAIWGVLTLPFRS